ncbi:MAG: ArsA-related P-loop ATPase [Actinomycetota bacterium]
MATGHIVAQVDAPASLARLVQVGIIRDQTRWMQEILHDQHSTGVVVVTTPEEMPVIETMDLIDTISSTTKVNVAGVIANRVYDDVSSDTDRDVLRRISQVVESTGGEHDADVRAVARVAMLSAQRRASAEEHLSVLSRFLHERRLPLIVVADQRTSSSKMNEALTVAISEELA